MSRREEIAVALNATRALLPENVTLIVVTKTFPVSDVEILYQLGERNFGENRDSEGFSKAEVLPDDVIWHFQGGIQSNKLRSIVAWSDYIHSLDDLRHAEKISTIAQELGKKQKCFIQINLDTAPLNTDRSGIKPPELLCFALAASELPGVEIVGVMGVGPINQDPHPAFHELHRCSQLLQEQIPTAGFISAGMSGDFQIAIECGATHVRLGSSILGSR
jgi:pyridoxal phosphate enzyme (YggS family)